MSEQHTVVLKGAGAAVQLRRAFGEFPSGVTAVCALGADGPIGMIASSFTSVSLMPPFVSVCFDQASRTWPQLADRPRIGISVLGVPHAPVCRALAAPSGPRFDTVRWQVTASGAVLLTDAPLQLECGIAQTVTAGDHWIVIFEVESFAVDDRVDPLVFHRSELHTWDIR